jgi:hypothetical protein
MLDGATFVNTKNCLRMEVGITKKAPMPRSLKSARGRPQIGIPWGPLWAGSVTILRYLKTVIKVGTK